MRIVGGEWRSRLIHVPDSAGLRPTPDRVRETVFNWLGQDLTGKRCLDLFAGSGALGLEAASRGAEEVVMVEKDAKVFGHLRESVTLLNARNIRLLRTDAINFLRGNIERFDVIFLDPPYRQGWIDKIEPFLLAALASDGAVYAEAEIPLTQLGELSVIKAGRAGQVYYQLLKVLEDE